MTAPSNAFISYYLELSLKVQSAVSYYTFRSFNCVDHNIIYYCDITEQNLHNI